METFYLGTHQPDWLRHAGVPLFISHNRLKDICFLPRARAPWSLDSGGFHEIDMYGRFRTTPAEYVAAVDRYDMNIGELAWAAPQDWMCEPPMLAKTGLTVRQHQALTVANYFDLRHLWTARVTAESMPFIPVLQGWTLTDYLECIDRYQQDGLDLAAQRIVGLGSVCRRQATDEIGDIVTAVRETVPGIRLHGFGVKTLGLRRYGHLLESADSMAWSIDARYGLRLPGCTTHKRCSNCLAYALGWRNNLLHPGTDIPVSALSAPLTRWWVNAGATA